MHSQLINYYFLSPAVVANSTSCFGRTCEPPRD
jgi:hypothetical protein